MFQVAVCDDDPEIQKRLHQFFQRISINESLDFSLKFFFSGEDLIHYYHEQECYPFHIIILAVKMNGLNGIETASTIRLLPDREVQIIFLTNYPEYILEGFEVQAFQYLLKPISYDLFAEKIVKLCRYILSSVHHFLSIKSKTEQLIIRHSEIIFISKGRYSSIQSEICIGTDLTNYFTCCSLKSIMNKLNYPFVFIHRSIIVNLSRIRKLSSSSVIMSNNQEFPVGRSHANSLQKAYARYIIAHFQKE